MRLFPRLVSEEAAEYGGRIHVLPPEVAHRIAAGEVIERPASAVKELIENSLDADASRIEVEIEGGGVNLIRVSDDGSGMSPSDAERAVAEHATSKIETADDLARVISLGFRGEALHAIGAVSALTLTTRERGARTGTRLQVFAGDITDSAPDGGAPGTTVEARDLFLNLPVRRGFLGTVRAEANANGDNSASLPRHTLSHRRDLGAVCGGGRLTDASVGGSDWQYERLEANKYSRSRAHLRHAVNMLQPSSVCFVRKEFRT